MAVAEKPIISVEDRTYRRYKLGIILNVIGLIILTLIIVSIYILVYVIKHRPVVNSEYTFLLVTRDEWIAQPPENPLLNLTLPVDRVIIGETQTEGCTTKARCIFRVRMIQMYHIESRHFDDIAYNFLVGGDGAIYEGRGWNKLGAHTKGYNAKSIGISMIGQFTKHTPPEKQFNVLKLLITEGVRLGKISKDYKLCTQRSFFETDSPGINVIKEIQDWPHFVNKVFLET